MTGRSEIQFALDMLVEEGFDIHLALAGMDWRLRWRRGGAKWETTAPEFEQLATCVLAWLQARFMGEGVERRYAREGWS